MNSINEQNNKESLVCADIEYRATAAENHCHGALNKLADLNRDCLYTFKHRKKTRKKIRNKARSYYEDNPDGQFDPYDEIKDAWACRYVLLSQEFMPGFVEKLVRLIVTNKPVDGISSPFKHGGLEEITIYDNRPDKDPLSIVSKVTDKLSRLLSPEDLENKVKKDSKPSGYSSVHIIAKVTVDYTTISGEDKKGVDVAVEVQIRDIFEDAWGEIEHRMVYSSKDDGEGENRPFLSDSIWGQHLNALKTLLDGCSQYASILYRYEQQSQIVENPKSDSAPLSLADTDKRHVISLLKQEGVGNQIILVVDAAYEQLKGVQEQRLQLSDPAYQELADTFADAIKVSQAFLDLKFSDGYSVRYFLESERLLALMNTTESELPLTVYDDYQKLFNQFPEDLVLAFRKGQILCRKTELQDFHLAVTVLEKAQANIENPRCRSSNFRQKGLNLLRDAIPVQIGHACALISERLIKTDPKKAKGYLERSTQLNQSVVDRCNLDMLSHVEADHGRILGRAINNFLNCLIDKERGDGTIAAYILSKRTPEWDKDRIAELLQWMDHPGLAKFRAEYSTRDTIMVVRAVLGETDLAKKEASAVMDELYKRALSYSSLEGMHPGLVSVNLKQYDEKLCYSRAVTIHTLLG
ncbi:MAG: hypothetical protein HW380_512 [Magnetococcales bacterium]|nr:hypothetical protein [Magnetococcales bacterium]HIJ85019.1 hypothetical protein [Magnetococcales bacterium]